MSEARKERRRNNYLRLRQCGFDSIMAQKFKDNSVEKIDELCKVYEEHMKDQNELNNAVMQRFNSILKKV